MPGRTATPRAAVGESRRGRHDDPTAARQAEEDERGRKAALLRGTEVRTEEAADADEELPEVPQTAWDEPTAARYGYTHPWELSGGNWLYVARHEGERVVPEANAGGGFDTLDKALIFTREIHAAGGPKSLKVATAKVIAEQLKAAAEEEKAAAEARRKESRSRGRNVELEEEEEEEPAWVNPPADPAGPALTQALSPASLDSTAVAHRDARLAAEATPPEAAPKGKAGARDAEGDTPKPDPHTLIPQAPPDVDNVPSVELSPEQERLREEDDARRAAEEEEARKQAPPSPGGPQPGGAQPPEKPGPHPEPQPLGGPGDARPA